MSPYELCTRAVIRSFALRRLAQLTPSDRNEALEQGWATGGPRPHPVRPAIQFPNINKLLVSQALVASVSPIIIIIVYR